jgi:hypothetical protein
LHKKLWTLQGLRWDVNTWIAHRYGPTHGRSICHRHLQLLCLFCISVVGNKNIHTPRTGKGIWVVVASTVAALHCFLFHFLTAEMLRICLTASCLPTLHHAFS